MGTRNNFCCKTKPNLLKLLNYQMELFNKELTDTDIHVRFSFPTQSLERLPDFEGNDFVDLKVKDSSQELRLFRCRKRKTGYSKPVLSKGWLSYVADYNLRIGDRVALVVEHDHVIGSQYKVDARRRIVLHGKEIWGDVPRA